MRAFAVFALLAVAAYAQIEPTPTEPELNPDAIVVKRQAEPEIVPDVEIEVLDGPAPAKEKRQAEPVETEQKPAEEPTVVVEKRQAVPATEQKPLEEPVVVVEKRQAEPATEQKPVEEPAVIVEKRQVDPEVIPVDEPTVVVQKRQAEPVETEQKPAEEPVVAVVKRESYPEGEETSGEFTEVVTDEEYNENRPKRQVAAVNATRKRRFADENAYPDCVCHGKHPNLPLYTALHAHCKCAPKPFPPHPRPPCNTCGHNHGPKAPCHGHGGSVYHHHHVHVVPHVAPVHRVHHDVHHHFVPKKPHYRAPCHRHSHSHDFDYKK